MEVETAIAGTKLKSAPGPDHISYEMIRHFPKAVRVWIVNLFNLIMTNSKCPKGWKTLKIAFIPKPNRTGYRPIAMSCCIGKIMEKIINDRLSWWLESKNTFSDQLCGFRRGKSCYDNLVGLRLDLDIARIQGLHTGVLFIDIEGAYNNVSIPTLIGKLIN